MLAFPGICWMQVNPHSTEFTFWLDIAKALAVTIVPIWVGYINVRNSNRKDKREREVHEKSTKYPPDINQKKDY